MRLFLIIFIIVVSSIYTYVGWRLIRPAQLRRPFKQLAWAGLYALLAAFGFIVVLRLAEIEAPWGDSLSWIAFVSFGAVILLFSLVAIRDLAGLVALALRRIVLWARHIAQPEAEPSTALDPSRRRFLVQSSNLGILILSGGLTGYGFYEARRRPEVVDILVPIVNLPDEFEGFRIAQITDIHAGPTIKRGWIADVVSEANRLKPDLTAVTGDLVDGTAQYLRDDVAPISDLRAPYGVYFITGNHEYYSGVKQWLGEVERLGLTILLNQHVVIERGNKHIVLAGVTDYAAGAWLPSHRSDPGLALAGSPPRVPRILLAHQPRSIYAAAKEGYDLQISGHTHGGQFFPGNILASLAQPYLSGLHKHDNTWIYVSRGTGYWGPPIRVAEPSEITIITLTRA